MDWDLELLLPNPVNIYSGLRPKAPSKLRSLTLTRDGQGFRVYTVEYYRFRGSLLRGERKRLI